MFAPVVAVAVDRHVHPVGVEVREPGRRDAAPVAPGFERRAEALVALRSQARGRHGRPICRCQRRRPGDRRCGSSSLGRSRRRTSGSSAGARRSRPPSPSQPLTPAPRRLARGRARDELQRAAAACARASARSSRSRRPPSRRELRSTTSSEAGDSKSSRASTRCGGASSSAKALALDRVCSVTSCGWRDSRPFAAPALAWIATRSSRAPRRDSCSNAGAGGIHRRLRYEASTKPVRVPNESAEAGTPPPCGPRGIELARERETEARRHSFGRAASLGAPLPTLGGDMHTRSILFLISSFGADSLDRERRRFQIDAEPTAVHRRAAGEDADAAGPPPTCWAGRGSDDFNRPQSRRRSGRIGRRWGARSRSTQHRPRLHFQLDAVGAPQPWRAGPTPR
jgi:hypothetical protein